MNQDFTPLDARKTVSEVEAQMDRIRQAQRRFAMASQAISAGLFDSPSEAPDAFPHKSTGESATRVAGMASAMQQVLDRLQTQSVEDVSSILRQQRALRGYQVELARQQMAASPTPAADADDIIDVVAKPVSPPSNPDDPVYP